MRCESCDAELAGKQTRFCSKKCKNKVNTRKWQVKAGVDRKLELILVCGGKCEDCGYAKNLAALIFHHVSGEKDFELNVRKITGTSLEKLKIELEKCVLLCHNCHMERHYPHLNTGY